MLPKLKKFTWIFRVVIRSVNLSLLRMTLKKTLPSTMFWVFGKRKLAKMVRVHFIWG